MKKYVLLILPFFLFQFTQAQQFNFPDWFASDLMELYNKDKDKFIETIYTKGFVKENNYEGEGEMFKKFIKWDGVNFEEWLTYNDSEKEEDKTLRYRIFITSNVISAEGLRDHFLELHRRSLISLGFTEADYTDDEYSRIVFYKHTYPSNFSLIKKEDGVKYELNINLFPNRVYWSIQRDRKKGAQGTTEP